MLYKTRITIWSDYPPAAGQLQKDVQNIMAAGGTATTHVEWPQEITSPVEDPDFTDGDHVVFEIPSTTRGTT